MPVDMCGSRDSPCSPYHPALCQYHGRTAWDPKLQYRHVQQLAVGHVWLRWCNDFCLAAVESELVQCHPLLHVLYTTGEAAGGPLRLVTWYLNIQLGVVSVHMIMDTVFDKYTAEIVAVYIKKQRFEYPALWHPAR